MLAERHFLIIVIALLGWQQFLPDVCAAEWVVIKVDRQPAKVFLAEVVDLKDNMVTLRDAKGGAMGAWQAQFLVGRVDSPPNERGKWTVDLLAPMVKKWEKFLADFPEAEPIVKLALLEAEAFMEKQAEEAAAKLKQQEEERNTTLASLLNTPAPDRASPPGMELIEEHIEKAKQLMSQWPQATEQLEPHLVPWMEMREALRSGKKWFEDGWKHPDEIGTILEERRQRKIREMMEQSAVMDIPGVVVEAPDMKNIQTGIMVSFGLCLLALIALLFWRTSHTTVVQTRSQGQVHLNHSGGMLQGMKVLFILISVILVGAEGFYIYRLWFYAKESSSGTAQPAASEELLRMVYVCSRPEFLKAADVPKEIIVTDEALNNHLAKHLAFKNSENSTALVRTRWVVHVSPQAILFHEDLRCGEKTWTATYEIKLIEEEGGTRFQTGKILVDGLPVPKILGGLLWNSFQEEFRKWIAQKNLNAHYGFAGVKENKIIFKLSMMPPLEK